ncbi:MAG: sulfatase-like hydrolase/transferase [Verrucomicrobiota bacterium]
MKNYFLLILSAVFAAGSLVAQDRPNIVLVYIDDWSWNGTPVAMDDSMDNSFMPLLQMPNLERLAKEGMKFTNAYGSPQCAPARVSVQTGQSSARSGFTLVSGKADDDYYDTRRKYRNLPVVPNVSDQSLDADAATIPEALEPLGYVSAHVGKWHMYSDPGAEGYVVHDGDTDNNPGTPNDPEVYATDPKLMFSITEKAIDFIEDQAKAGNPFFCQISHYAMHAGSQCLDETRQKYRMLPELQAYYKTLGKRADKLTAKSDPATWLGMAEDIDGRIGAVLDKLDALGIADNTYVVVVSDNGYRHSALHLTPGNTQPLHGHKWWAWQGGIRVPMIVKGPAIEPNSVFEANVANYDFLPTFVEWSGGDPGSLEDIDGVSLAGYLSGDEPDDSFLNRNLYFHVPHYRSEIPHSAVISDQTKVIHFYEEPDIPMLFDLSGDPGEVSNIAKEQPETRKRLFGEMMRYFSEVGARLPKSNPDYDPVVYEKLENYDKLMLWGPFEDSRPLEEDEK